MRTESLPINRPIKSGRELGMVLGANLLALVLAGCGSGSASLVQQWGCSACHADDRKLVGPAFRDIAARYRGQPQAQANLVAKVRNGGTGVWGQMPMPPHPAIPDADLQAMIKIILAAPAP
jgi:cytochrome c